VGGGGRVMSVGGRGLRLVEDGEGWLDNESEGDVSGVVVGEDVGRAGGVLSASRLTTSPGTTPMMIGSERSCSALICGAI